MAVFINGIGTISAQRSWLGENFLDDPLDYVGDRLNCVEPEYSQYVDIKQLRRMSRIIKMGMASGLSALRDGGVEVPNGIITGTSFGCLDDTGIFLGRMIENQENALNPTPFIQSTHNTIGSQIALLLQCQGYNQTYTQRAFSFENALLDAVISIEENPRQNILTGAADETTSVSHDILKRFKIFRSESKNSLKLFEEKKAGTLNGEGAAYFLLSGAKGKKSVEVVGVDTFYKPGNRIVEYIGRFFNSNSINLKDIDVVLVGKSGDVTTDIETDTIVSSLFSSSTITVFKHLTGEFPTASALAMSIASRMVETKRIPQVLKDIDRNRSPGNVLIYNPYFGTHHSLILLRAC